MIKIGNIVVTIAWDSSYAETAMQKRQRSRDRCRLGELS
jgi:hypothetical protein